ncbi:MAG: hypothetical protein K6A79_00550 [Ruminococcus sp.]|nr:hypothetical protein [Ruminococcus sp.]
MVTRVIAGFDTPEKAGLAMERIMQDVNGVYSANIVSEPAVYAPAESPLQAVDSIAEEAPDTRRSSSGHSRSSLYIVCDGSRSDEIYSLIMTMGGINMA